MINKKKSPNRYKKGHTHSEEVKLKISESRRRTAAVMHRSNPFSNGYKNTVFDGLVVDYGVKRLCLNLKISKVALGNWRREPGMIKLKEIHKMSIAFDMSIEKLTRILHDNK